MRETEHHFHFVSLFPETIDVWLKSSILGRAHTQGLFSYTLTQLRDFATDKHASVDDAAYGGGGGMVLKVEPLVLAIESLQQKYGKENTHIIYFSPKGQELHHQFVKEAAKRFAKKHLILICGHYEGVDQRFIDHWVQEEISLGDFVLTGGELPAVAFVDAVARQIEGVLGNADGPEEESFALMQDGVCLLEYPHYTRPQTFRNLSVPDVLLSGDHEKISQWRRSKSTKKQK